jgi:uncharacterized repeat protein (TIGR03803 family)
MKTFTKQLFLLPALIAALGLLLTGRATAQPVTTLHTFPVSVLGINSDGAKPLAGPILSGNTLYGTAYIGGTNGKGAVFAVNTDSSGFTNLHSFTTLLGPFPPTNSEGADPRGGLLISGNTLYGTANAGGSSGVGTVFALNTDGSGLTNLHSFTALTGPNFTNNDGANPYAGLILSGKILYGTANAGGSSGVGTVFAVSTNGTGFTNLYNFSGGDDGVNPQGGLVLAGSTLYGTTFNGGTNGNGTVFAINTNGAGFTKLYSFTAKNYNGVTGGMTNSDGANPYAGLILSGGTLYGTASTGGDSDFGNGTVFAINTNGAGFTNLHSLTYADGASPFAGLILSGKTLYGAAAFRGSSGYGTLFAVNTNGTGFTNYYNFSGGSDGAYPEGSVILSGNTLYGTAEGGDSSSANGNVFSLALVFAPRLNIIRSGTNVIVTWTNTASGFTLLFTTNLVSPAVWTTNSPLPVVINGQNTVTNPIAGTKKFYRLVK